MERSRKSTVERMTEFRGHSHHLPVSGGSDGGHVEQLPGVVLDAAEHHHGDGVALPLNGIQDVLCPQSVFSLGDRKEWGLLCVWRWRGVA